MQLFKKSLISIYLMLLVNDVLYIEQKTLKGLTFCQWLRKKEKKKRIPMAERYKINLSLLQLIHLATNHSVQPFLVGQGLAVTAAIYPQTFASGSGIR